MQMLPAPLTRGNEKGHLHGAQSPPGFLSPLCCQMHEISVQFKVTVSLHCFQFFKFAFKLKSEATSIGVFLGLKPVLGLSPRQGTQCVTLSREINHSGPTTNCDRYSEH